MVKVLVFAIVITAMISCGKDEPLTNYEPKSLQEQALKSVLLDFQDGVNNLDSKKIGDLIHENASIMTGRDRKIISRAEYVDILSERLVENPPFSLGTPRIKISDHGAEVKTYMSRGNSRVLITFQMQYENSRWYIKGWEY